MTCNAPIDIITNSAQNDSNALICNYYSGDATFNVRSKLAIITYGDTDTPSNIKYKGMTFMLKGISIYKRAVHSINGKFATAEMVMMHRNTATQETVCICIPILLTLKQESSFGTLLSTVPFTVHDYQSPKIFVPSGTFYSYTAPLFFNCNSTNKNEYIVFESSNITITQAELNKIPAQIFPISQMETPIFKHSRQSSSGKTISFNDDKVYIDCQPIDATDDSNDSNENAKPNKTSPSKSISFTQMKNNKFIQAFLIFIIMMIVLVIFFYSYEFTAGMFRELTKNVSKMTPNLS